MITLPTACNQSGGCILHRLKLFDDGVRDVIAELLAREARAAEHHG